MGQGRAERGSAGRLREKEGEKELRPEAGIGKAFQREAATSFKVASGCFMDLPPACDTG